MTFGGEPLLFADTACQIHAAARDRGIPVRQIITNGFFSKEESGIDAVAQSLCASGVNDILLSVDAFHQESIPLEPVLYFARALLRHGAPTLRAHPAWVVNEQHENPYNVETKRLLRIFAGEGFLASSGNNIFPSGNALKYLAEYYAPPEEIDLTVPCGSAPYTSSLDAADCIGINPNGDVILCSIAIGNIYAEDILDIVDRYDPYQDPATKMLLNGGVPELLRYAESQDVTVDVSGCRSACGVCRKAMEAMNGKREG